MPSLNKSKRNKSKTVIRQKALHLKIVFVETLYDLISNTCQVLNAGTFFRVPLYKTFSNDNIRGVMTGWFDTASNIFCFFSEGKHSPNTYISFTLSELLPMRGMQAILRNQLLNAGWRKIGDAHTKI